jgi:hypothetical protein
MQKNTTLSGHIISQRVEFRTIRLVYPLHFALSVCTRPGKWTVMYLCVRSIGVCLSSRILPHDFGTVLTLWYFLHDFGTVLTVWYFFYMISEQYHTVRTVPKLYRKIPHCQNSSEIILENTTLSEQFRNHAEKYHTVRTVPKSCRAWLVSRGINTLYKQFMISKLKQLCSPVICEKCHFTHIWK